jgi:hypothetical protein
MAKLKLSAAFSDLRGKVGTFVISKTRSGLVMKPRVTPSNPNTSLQEQARTNLSNAAATFRGLNAAKAQNWENYAANQQHSNPIAGRKFKPTGIDVFVGLASKFLQVNPTGSIPLDPPTSGFTGDQLTFTVTPGTGQVTVAANAGNSTNTTTEFLVQKLNSPHVNPQEGAYRHSKFFHYATGSLSTTITLGSGYWAIAYRYVNTLTGQQSETVGLPIQTVSLSVSQGGKAINKKAA